MRGSILGEKRTDVFADSAFDFDVEPRVRRNIEGLPGSVVLPGLFSLELDAAGACHDLHAFGGLSPKMERARINHAERLLARVWKENRMAHDLSVEINIGLCDGRHA